MSGQARGAWRRTSVANRRMVWLTGIVAFGTVCLGVASLFQYLAARQQANTARELAITAREQSNVMQRQLNTMEDQANSMKAQTNTLNDSLTETRKSVSAAEKQAEASMSQAATSGKIVAQNERMVKAAETQASAAKTTTNINSQIIVGLQPILISLNQNGQIATEIHMSNTSNFTVSIRSLTVKYVFTKEARATVVFTADDVNLDSFDLGPGWKGVAGHSFSPVLAPDVLAAIEEGRLNVFWFARYFILNKSEPASGCYVYDRLTKGWTNCGK
jgi:vacuolar-type H+-ATPase subunit D/Vma8